MKYFKNILLIKLLIYPIILLLNPSIFLQLFNTLLIIDTFLLFINLFQEKLIIKKDKIKKWWVEGNRKAKIESKELEAFRKQYRELHNYKL